MLIASLLTIFVHFAEAESNAFSARVILFIPENAESPEGYEARLSSLALKTESFLAKWLNHWERNVDRTDIFARNDDGSIQVSLVKGALSNTNGREALPKIRKSAINGATKSLGLDENDEIVWWIFYDYEGVKGFRGSGGSNGGVAINRYPPGIGEISQELDLASPELASVNAKGTIHEFGHALGLPHIGPQSDLRFGNSLMGPINRAFAKKAQSTDTRVHLTEASAAILWKHPIFEAEDTPKPKMPQQIKITDLNVSESKNGDNFTVSGSLHSDQSVHTAALFDSNQGRFGDYWTRSYVGAVDKKGRFSVVVEDPFEKGSLFLSFFFDNGVNTSDGKKPLMQGSVIKIPYSGTGENRTFELPN